MIIEELIARLEKATRSDRGLDQMLAEIVVSWKPPAGMTYSAGLGFADYTASIDAALTLVPEEYAVSLEWSPRFPGHAWIYPPDNTDDISFEGDACCPALALCIAALKARKASVSTRPSPATLKPVVGEG